MSDVVDRLRDLAYIGHDGQFRRGPLPVPYIEHPKAVVETLKRWGIDDDAILAAAWAHDLLEDTDITRDEISNAGGAELGQRILEYVVDLTYVPSMDGTKKEWLEGMAKKCCPDVLYIKAADRYCNTLDFYDAGKFTKAKNYIGDAWELIFKVCHWNAKVKKDFGKLMKDIANHT